MKRGCVLAKTIIKTIFSKIIPLDNNFESLPIFKPSPQRCVFFFLRPRCVLSFSCMLSRCQPAAGLEHTHAAQPTDSKCALQPQEPGQSCRCWLFIVRALKSSQGLFTSDSSRSLSRSLTFLRKLEDLLLGHHKRKNNPVFRKECNIATS